MDYSIRSSDIHLSISRLNSERFEVLLVVGGIVNVFLSVLCSLAAFGHLKISTTMLTVELIAFLELAVGMDYIYFILVHTQDHLLPIFLTAVYVFCFFVRVLDSSRYESEIQQWLEIHC